MRTKSFPVRSWQRSSNKSVDPNPSPNEANEIIGSRARITYSDSHCERDNADVEIVPETFEESDVSKKKRRCLETSETGREGSEPLNLDACIVCEISDKWVSRCSGTDCVLSFHGKCLNAELGDSEDLANQYCPYCWFKILALKSKSATEKVIREEKAVAKYLGKEIKESNVPKDQELTTISGDENGNQEHSVDSTDIVELQGEKDVHSSKEKQVEKDSDKSNEKNMLSIKDINKPEEEKEKLKVGNDKSGEDKVMDEVEASEDEERVATENFQDAEDDEISNDQTEVNTVAVRMGDDSPFVSIQESFSGEEHNQIRQKKMRRRVVIDNETSVNDVTVQITSSAEVTSQSGKRKLIQAKPKIERNISYFKMEQKRRTLWTCEEEEMLKVGVEKFAAEANKNIPWRKILEMGEEVFHETRTPADLKDKWRNMNGGRLTQKTKH